MCVCSEIWGMHLTVILKRKYVYKVHKALGWFLGSKVSAIDTMKITFLKLQLLQETP